MLDVSGAEMSASRACVSRPNSANEYIGGHGTLHNGTNRLIGSVNVTCVPAPVRLSMLI